MAVPTGVLWARDPHTVAKHTLLRRYLMAWFPIMAKQFHSDGITFLDGFAGPGAYSNSPESSPVIAMEQAVRDEVAQLRTPIRLVFIEQQKNRAEHLKNLLEDRFGPSRRPPWVIPKVHCGNCPSIYEAAIEEVGGWSGPVFANLDGWGADTHYHIVQRIAQQKSSEVLVTFKDQFFTRFADVEDQEAGDRVFGLRDWREVARRPSTDKKPFLLSLYRRRLIEAGFTQILTFEMIDEGGHSLYLFFGTTNIRAVEKFKDGLWEVDGISGQRFRDPRNPDQMSFDILQPDFTPLATAFFALIEQRGSVSLHALGDYALLETIYKRAHAKTAVDKLLTEGKIEPAGTGRSYAERIYRLAPASLF